MTHALDCMIMHRRQPDDGPRRAARAGRRHHLRGRGHRRRPRRRRPRGEVVFNTVLSGYQEVITDPSYAGQIITFTYPHIGNYGVNLADFECRRPFCRGVVVRDLARRRSSWRSEADLDAQLRAYGIPGIAGIDTRKLTRRIRDVGAIPGAFGPLDLVDEATLLAAAQAEPGTDGVDLVAQVTTAEPYRLADGTAPARGRLRLRHQAHDPAPPGLVVRRRGRARRRTTRRRRARPRARRACSCPTAPATRPRCPTPPRPSPALLGNVPVFGICLGHQLLGRALGAATVKLPFGHHGGNHPVRNLATGKVEITSQNHNFAVDADSLGGRAEMTHVNLNDGVCEGLRVLDAPAFSVQHHPEAGPGPPRQRLPVRGVRHHARRHATAATAPAGHPEADRGVA